jgi:hypothetical protein
MAEQRNHIEVAFLARLAGITVPPDRLPALSMGLSGLQAICEALARLDYGTLPPADRFEVPAAR